LTKGRPLTYSEIVRADPFTRKLDNGLTLTIKQWGALETMEIFQTIQSLKPLWERVKTGQKQAANSMVIFNFIAHKLYGLSKKPFFKWRYKKRFFKWANDNIGQILDIWEDLSKSQTCTFFFNRLPLGASNGPGHHVHKDWFKEYCGQFDPITTPWLRVRSERELEKANSIEQYHRQKKANGTRK